MDVVTPISEPGVYDIPAEQYHADPVEGGSLSSTGARRLLDMPPARWKWEQEHPPAPTAAMILGTAVHSLVLGTGSEVVAVDADDWRTAKAKAARKEALAAGYVPLLRDEHKQASDMAAAVLSHPIAGHVFTSERGAPEQTMVWFDAEFGVWRRSMVDHLPHEDASVRPILADLKTTPDASPRALSKTIANFGYHCQDAFYRDGWEALYPDSDPGFIFVFVEKTPPYLVSVIELDQPAVIVGREMNRRALAVYADCRAAGVWPGHSPEIELVGLPAWVSNRLEEYPF